MLQTIFNQSPPPKSVIINDNRSLQGRRIVASIIKHAVKMKLSKIHVFLLENSVDRFKRAFRDNDIVCYNHVSSGNLLKTLNDDVYDGIIVIDSLVHVVIEYGLAETYRGLHRLLSRKDRNVVQLVTIFHEDVIDDDGKTAEYFKRLVTLSVNLFEVPKRCPRVKYWYKKSSGKIVQDTEEYFFRGDSFCTRYIERLDAKSLLAEATVDVQPFDLASFKIDLSESDKKLKENFTLPYLKTSESDVVKPGEGNIIYNLDENDDWDEEDPDDDLDI